MADVSKIKLPDNSVLDIRDNSKIADPSTKSSGQYLTYNGTSWVADDIPQTAVNTLSIDSAPVAASSNLITSGGVYSAIQNIPSPPVTSVNTQTGAVVLDANDIDYDSTYTIKGKKIIWLIKTDKYSKYIVYYK